MASHKHRGVFLHEEYFQTRRALDDSRSVLAGSGAALQLLTRTLTRRCSARRRSSGAANSRLEELHEIYGRIADEEENSVASSGVSA